MERRKFEDAVKDGFNGAEVTPAESVWTNIELDLERAEGGKMKRRLLFYKLLAAASVAFALSVAGVGYYVYTHDQPTQLATAPTSTNNDSRSNNPGKHDAAGATNPASTSTQGNNDGYLTDTNTNHGNENAGSDEAAPRSSLSEQATGAETTARDAQQQAAQRTATRRSGQTPAASADASSLAASSPTNAASIPGVGNRAHEPVTPNAPSTFPNRAAEQPLVQLNTNRATNAAPSAAPATGIAPGSTADTRHAAVASPGAPAQQQGGLALDAEPTNDTPEHVYANGATGGRTLPALYALDPKLVIPAMGEDPVQKMFRALREREQELYASAEKADKKKGEKSEKLWTSLGFAAGGFNAVNSGVSPQAGNAFAATATSNAVADKQAKASGQTYSIGVSVGTKLSRRWVLQGGVNYLTQSSDYTANNVVADNNFQSLKAESINNWGAITQQSAGVADADARLAPTFPYSVNNSVRFMSVPVQAGYLVVNRRFGLQFNAGLSTDLFLQNTITPENANLSKTTQGAGDESPYRTVNFSGLMGTELTYKFGQRYRLALNPGLRYPLNSVYKSEIGVRSMPLTFDVGLRFRYIFQ